MNRINKFYRLIFIFINLAAVNAFAQDEIGVAPERPGYVLGPLTGVGIPQSRTKVQEEDNNKIELPESAAEPWITQCEGANCQHSDTILMDQPGAPSNISILSPLGSMRETMGSQKMADIFKADATKGGTALSNLSNTIQSWMNVSPNSATAILASLQFAGSFTEQRYLAEQNAELAFANAGSQGRIISQSYRTCISNLIQENFTYAAAQETCMKNQDKRPIGLDAKEDASFLKEMDFKSHTSHPLFEGKRSVPRGNTWEVVDVRNQAAPSINTIFDPSDRGNSDPKVIRLRHLMFVPTLSNIALGVFPNPVQVEEGVRQLAADWLRLFGDIEYSYQAGGIPNSAFMGLAIRRIKPTFTYREAVSLAPRKGFPQDLYSENAPTGFKQFVTYREHIVYDQIWRVMSDYCRVLKKRVPGNTALQDAQYEAFFDLDETDSENKAKDKDIRQISTSFFSFDASLGDDLFRYIKDTIGDKEVLCDNIDPRLSSDGAGQTSGLTSVKNLVAQLRFANESKDRSSVTKLRSDVYTLAQIIAGDQVNSTVAAAYGMLGTISGGDFESRAKASAEMILQSMIGGLNPDARRMQYMNAYREFRIALRERK